MERNYRQLHEYSSERNDSSCLSDIPISLAPVSDISREKLKISLILSSDGVNITGSSTQHELWPISLSITQLPPKLRFSQKNLALAALFVGLGKPP